LTTAPSVAQRQNYAVISFSSLSSVSRREGDTTPFILDQTCINRISRCILLVGEGCPPGDPVCRSYISSFMRIIENAAALLCTKYIQL